MGVVKAVCISERRGIEKKNVGSAEFAEGFGIRGDAHGGTGTGRSASCRQSGSKHLTGKGQMWFTAPSGKIWW